jgi:hypothetical protein
MSLELGLNSPNVLSVTRLAHCMDHPTFSTIPPFFRILRILTPDDASDQVWLGRPQPLDG